MAYVKYQPPSFPNLAAFSGLPNLLYLGSRIRKSHFLTDCSPYIKKVRYISRLKVKREIIWQRRNAFDNLERPGITLKPIQTLSLKEACVVDSVIHIITEKVAWELTFGHGWRQIEVRRITAGDVRLISDGLIWCRGKEREEPTPLLPKTQELLQQLTGTLSDDELVIRSTRIRAGMTQPLGADGMRQLIQRFLMRSNLKYEYTGHDLRRSFCTLVREASGDEFLAMRLARDIIPGVNDRYINADPFKLRESLLKYSPIRQIRHEQAGESLVEVGESRTLLSITGNISHDARPISYLSTSSVREPSFQEAWNSVILESDPAKLLPRLLDQLTVLGQTAQQLRQALDNNRHHPDTR